MGKAILYLWIQKITCVHVPTSFSASPNTCLSTTICHLGEVWQQFLNMCHYGHKVHTSMGRLPLPYFLKTLCYAIFFSQKCSGNIMCQDQELWMKAIVKWHFVVWCSQYVYTMFKGVSSGDQKNWMVIVWKQSVRGTMDIDFILTANWKMHDIKRSNINILTC
jgi:hypothetical protein